MLVIGTISSTTTHILVDDADTHDQTGDTSSL